MVITIILHALNKNICISFQKHLLQLMTFREDVFHIISFVVENEKNVLASDYIIKTDWRRD